MSSRLLRIEFSFRVALGVPPLLEDTAAYANYVTTPVPRVAISFNGFEGQRRANRFGLRKHVKLLANDPKPEPQRRDQLEQSARKAPFSRIVYRMNNITPFLQQRVPRSRRDARVSEESRSACQ